MGRSSFRTAVDPLSGRTLVFAPARAKRGGQHQEQAGPEDAPSEPCPFCEGNESHTPPEVLALGTTAQRQSNSPGWQIRVVPNLFPAFPHHYIVIHSPAHIHSLGELPPEQLSLVAEAWAEIADRAWKEGFDHPFVFINEGKDAGASRDHSHSQLVWLEEMPPQIAAEASSLRRGDCVVCTLLAKLPSELFLASQESDAGSINLVISPFGRAPYELLIAPSKHLADGFGSVDGLAAALALAASGVRRLFKAEGPLPYNLWLHSFQVDGHWHFELLPRLSEFAGIELGMGVFINSLEPREAAARLRRETD